MAGYSTDELLKRLDDQHKAYLETFRLVHEALSRAGSANVSQLSEVPTSPTSPTNSVNPSTLPQIPEVPTSPISPIFSPSRRRTLSTDIVDGERLSTRKASTYHSSVLTGESSESDDDGELYVQTPLTSYKFDHNSLREHLTTCDFEDHTSILLNSVVENKRLLRPELFPEYPPEERWHNSHYSIFDVGQDGAPVSRRRIVKEGTISVDSAIFQAIQNVNVNSQVRDNVGENVEEAIQRPAVGRITIIREPSPIVFGALHMVMNEAFDMDEVYRLLVDDDEECELAHLTNRSFLGDHRQQRSIVFKFDYHTIVGDELQPMPWQRTDLPDKVIDKSEEHMHLSRCTSVVALSLEGKHLKKMRNLGRKATTKYGFAYDPWSPWQVLNIQCFPDHKHSMDSHDSTKHYVNGPEAFLHTLLAEFKDSERRLDDVSKKIRNFVMPPANLMFDGKMRDKLLFEDENFTYSRRYFWAFQTVGVMNTDIKAMIDAYRDTFTDEVWSGKHKTLWPMLEEDTSRNVYWRRRMVTLRKQFEVKIDGLDKLYEENDDLRKEIVKLRDQLFSGTSVLESRKSVDLASVTILQGHNIKLLTLVSIFFLPLTFVTSVFGMTNMPTEHRFTWFGVTLATVCIPFFLLVGSLNTNSGMEFWISRWQMIASWILRIPPPPPNVDHMAPPGHQIPRTESGKLKVNKRSRTKMEAKRAIQIRQQQVAPAKVSSTASSTMGVSTEATSTSAGPSHSAISMQSALNNRNSATREEQKTVAPADYYMLPLSSTIEKSVNKEAEKRKLPSWWDKVLKRRKRDDRTEQNV